MEISKEILAFQKIMKDAGLICKSKLLNNDYDLSNWNYESSCTSFWLCDICCVKKDEQSITWTDKSYVSLYDFTPIAKYEMYDRLILEGTGALKCRKRDYDFNNIHRFKAALEKAIKKIKKLEIEFRKNCIKKAGAEYVV